MSSSTLSKKLTSVKPGTVFVGVDLALDRNVAVVLTERAEQLARFGFPNEREGYDYFYRQLEAIQKRQQAPAVLVGMEPTNYFWKLLAADMEQHRPNYGFRLVNPFTVKKNREAINLIARRMTTGMPSPSVTCSVRASTRRHACCTAHTRNFDSL
jgi:hypothetical protein